MEPFESTALFNDRYDDGSLNYHKIDNKLGDLRLDLSDNKKNQVNLSNSNPVGKEMEVTMPNVDDFWVTKEEDNVETEKPLSFDEQIANLVSEDNKTKVRKVS